MSDLNLKTASRAIFAIAAFAYWYTYDCAHESFHGPENAFSRESVPIAATHSGQRGSTSDSVSRCVGAFKARRERATTVLLDDELADVIRRCPFE